MVQIGYVTVDFWGYESLVLHRVVTLQPGSLEPGQPTETADAAIPIDSTLNTMNPTRVPH